MLLSWLRAGPPMLNATQPRAGRASSVSVPNRLSPAARVATSFAACAFPAASRVAAAVLHAAARVICSYSRRTWNHQLLSVLLSSLLLRSAHCPAGSTLHCKRRMQAPQTLQSNSVRFKGNISITIGKSVTSASYNKLIRVSPKALAKPESSLTEVDR